MSAQGFNSDAARYVRAFAARQHEADRTNRPVAWGAGHIVPTGQAATTAMAALYRDRTRTPNLEA